MTCNKLAINQVDSLEFEISKIIADYWLKEERFIGVKTSDIMKQLSKNNNYSEKEIIDELKIMDNKGLVSLNSKESDIFVFPKKSLLEPFDNLTESEVGIYKKQLRLGGSQIEFRYFDRKVLDGYIHDPRYSVEETAVGGHLWITNRAFLDESVPEEDKIGIQTFDLAYKKEGTRVIRVIGVILAYLGNLSVKHQKIWEVHEIKEKCYLDEDAFNQAFMCEPTDRVSIFDSFLQEIKEINLLSSLIGKPPLFRKEYEIREISTFRYLTKPTRKDLEDFVHTLDKLISENLNKGFFREDISLEEEIPHREGKIEVRQKGTLRLLDEWIKQNFRFPDPRPMEKMFSTFEEIRKWRQPLAHKITKDDYDEKIKKEQQEIMIEAYSAIRTLRLILMNHPLARSYNPPKWLQKGRIT